MTPIEKVRILAMAKIKDREAEIEALQRAVQTASPGWIRSAVIDWESARERLAGYRDGLNDAIDMFEGSK